MQNVVRIKSTEYSHNKTNMDAFTLIATASSRGYHVYKTSWITAKVGDKVTIDLEMTESSLETDPYACTIRIKSKYFSNIITVWAHPTRILRHVHFFIKTDCVKVNGHVQSLTYRPSLIPSGRKVDFCLTNVNLRVSERFATYPVNFISRNKYT